MKLFRSLVFAIPLLFVFACSVNPVTGKKQLSMPISEQIAMGAKQYGPSQQAQGGRYVVDPELSFYVSSVGKKIAAHSDLKLPYEFVVLNNDVPNAWALPGGKIAINRGLLVLLEDESQLAAVLGHEIVHAAAEHGATQMRKQQLLGLGVVLAGVASKDSEYNQAITMGAAVGAQAWQAHYGRDQELQADKYGVNYMYAAGYTPQGAVELQQTFVKLSAAAGKQDPISALFASHPPSQERVNKNQKRAELLTGGARNKRAFQNAIAQIKKDAPAYKLNSEAIKKAGEQKWEEALALSKRAASLQPKEAMFPLTSGRILMAQKQFKGAASYLRKAKQLNPEYFLPTLMHGLNARELGDKAAAKLSLEKSISLLPTPIAAYYLGEIELAAGNTALARKWFNAAASDQGEIGEKARAQLEALATP